MSTATFAQARLAYKLTNEIANKAPGTIAWYDANLQRLETYLLERDGSRSLLLTTITTEDIRQFIQHLQSKSTTFDNHPYHKPEGHGLSPFTIRGIVASLSAFFRWTVAEGLLAKNPMERIARPKTPKSSKERFTEAELKQLLDACKQYPAAIAERNRAILHILLDTGVRAAELVNLRMDRLDLEHGRATVTGKGAKDRLVYFGKITRKMLLFYLVNHRGPDPSPYVFLSRTGRPLTVDGLEQLLKDLGVRAGVAHVNPHKFRHTAARLFIRHGGNAFALQQMLGHEDLSTTRRYVELERSDLEEMYARSSPVDRLHDHTNRAQ